MDKKHSDKSSSLKDKGVDNMTTVALPKKTMVVIDESKFQEFLLESEKNKVTPEILKRCQRFEKKIVRKDKHR